VQRRSLSSQVHVNGTLGYRGSYTILGAATGTYTRLPAAGDVIEPGHPLYSVDLIPVILLRGSLPLYRSLSEGMSGADVRQLNRDLVALGYATKSQLDPRSDYFSVETAYAIERLQKHFGVTETGTLQTSAAVFEPGAVRITTVMAKVGGAAAPGAPVAQATSVDRQIVAAVDAGQQAHVHRGDRVAITLADQTLTSGVVTSVGTVASSPSGGGGGGSPTVDVYVRPLHPGATGRLDQEPVQVAITTATAADALVVPVDSLLALASGGYAVEVASGRGERRLVAVTLGLFDDADGLVQVEGDIAAGQRVVVPAS
jgi:peptidoglycan hydrolase-like protein with peptidoglycan-binding domain